MKHYRLFILWEGKKRMTFECEGLSKVGLQIRAEQIMQDKIIGNLVKGYAIK